MSLKKLKNGNWQADLTEKTGKRIRRQFKTKIEAARFEHFILSAVESAKPWINSADKRTLAEIIEEWINVHGQNLRDKKKRSNVLRAMCQKLKNPLISKLTANDFLKYRNERLENGISKKTVNNELGYFKAVFNELKSLGLFNDENPLQKIKPLKIPERELTFLGAAEIEKLFDSLRLAKNPHCYLIAFACLSTGARWSEVESLKLSQVSERALTFVGTKSGKNRTVPVSPELADQLKTHLVQHGGFSFSLSAFRRALVRSGLDLPAGQASHVLRHTFASHFVQNGGNIYTLQKILGHSSIAMTMRYSHLTPDHLSDAVQLNPLASGKITATTEKTGC